MSVPKDDRVRFAQEFLRLAHENYRTHYAQRVYFARLARQYGLSNQAIADAYGITEAAVRAMLRRAEGDS